MNEQRASHHELSQPFWICIAFQWLLAQTRRYSNARLSLTRSEANGGATSEKCACGGT